MAREFYRDAKTRNLAAGALVLNMVGLAGAIFVNTRVSGDIIALHHNVYFGITLIGEPRQVYVIPVLGFFLMLINVLISYLIQHKNKFFVYLFSASSLVLQFFLLLGIGSIILINFR